MDTRPADGLPENAAAFHRAARARITVPAGEFLIALPPRRSGRHSRTTDPIFVLAVTEQGLWGVLDRTQTPLFLDEPDLQRIARISERTGDRFGVVQRQRADVPLLDSGLPGPISLTRGEIVRIVQERPGALVVDFNSPLRDHGPRREQIARLSAHAAPLGAAPTQAALAQVASPAIITPSDTVKPLDIIATVGAERLVAWHSGRADYGEIFIGAFRSIRIRNTVVLGSSCGRELTFTDTRSTKSSRSFRIEGNFAVSLEALLDHFTTSLGLSAGASETEEISRSVQATLNRVETLALEVRPVRYRPLGTRKETIVMIGEVRSCAGAPALRSFMLQEGAVRRFLHEWMRRADDGERPERGEWDNDPTTRLLASLPGGSPLHADLGERLAFRCWAQQEGFEDLAHRHRFSRFEKALLRLLSVQFGSVEQDLTRFFAACPEP